MTVGFVGIALHLIFLAWIAPIAFFDDGMPAPDWTETIIPFSVLCLPLAIALIGRNHRAFNAAWIVALLVAALFFIGPGIFLLLPALCYFAAAWHTA